MDKHELIGNIVRIAKNNISGLSACERVEEFITKEGFKLEALESDNTTSISDLDLHSVVKSFTTSEIINILKDQHDLEDAIDIFEENL